MHGKYHAHSGNSESKVLHYMQQSLKASQRMRNNPQLCPLRTAKDL